MLPRLCSCKRVGRRYVAAVLQRAQHHTSKFACAERRRRDRSTTNMAECAARFRSRANADSIGALLHPGPRAAPSALRRKGRPARDHARENVLAIRRAEKENRQRKEEAANAVKKPYKMKQFGTSRVAGRQQAEKWENPTLSPREDATYLKRGAGQTAQAGRRPQAKRRTDPRNCNF